MTDEPKETGPELGQAGNHGRRSKTWLFVALPAACVTLAVVGALAVGRSESPQPASPSTATQRAALDWTQHNEQMWLWMRSHWDEMALMDHHWGDAAWMQSNLPDWAWMHARWDSMIWMHQNWQVMTWMRVDGMMGGSAPGDMMGQ